MRIMLVFIGVLTVLGGLWPFLRDMQSIPESLKIIPSSGPYYQLIIILIGVFAMLYGLRGQKAQMVR